MPVTLSPVKSTLNAFATPRFFGGDSKSGPISAMKSADSRDFPLQENHALDAWSRTNSPQPQDASISAKPDQPIAPLHASMPDETRWIPVVHEEQQKYNVYSRQALLQLKKNLLNGTMKHLDPQVLAQVLEGLKRSVTSKDKDIKVLTLKTIEAAIQEDCMGSQDKVFKTLLNLQTLFPDPEVKSAAIQLIATGIQQGFYKELPDYIYNGLKNAESSEPPILQRARIRFNSIVHQQLALIQNHKEKNGLFSVDPEEKVAHILNLNNNIKNHAMIQLPSAVRKVLESAIFEENVKVQAAAISTLGSAMHHKLIKDVPLFVQEKLIQGVSSTNPSVKLASIQTLGQAYPYNLMDILNNDELLVDVSKHLLAAAMASANPDIKKAAKFTINMIANPSRPFFFNNPNATNAKRVKKKR